MTKLEKFGLIIAIPSGIVTILEYLEKINLIKFINDNFEWIPLKIKDSIIWIYENIILLEVNVWIFLVLMFSLYKFNLFIKNKKINKTSINEEMPKSLIDIFKEFDKDTQKVFGYIMYCQEKIADCTKESINRKFKTDNISNLELDKIIEKLIDEDIIEPHYNVIQPTKFTLTKCGSDIAVSLIKNSKKGNK